MTLKDILISTIIISISVIVAILFVYVTSQLSLIFGKEIYYTVAFYHTVFVTLILIFAAMFKRG